MIVSVVNNDVLMVALCKPTSGKKEVTRQGPVAEIRQAESGQVEGYNFFGLNEELSIDTVGAVSLSEADVKFLNDQINQAGFEEALHYDGRPSFVVGLVKECEKLEDSDHLNITQTEVDQGQVLQIVCGAPNIKAGQKVVVAREGAIMPDGSAIWAGELRGVESNGMICSARELELKDAPKKRGILELSDDYQVGQAFFD